jgi:uncharacterized cupredoxin-like copper-binding protein
MSTDPEVDTPSEPNPLTRTVVAVGIFMAAVVAAVVVGLVVWSPPALGDVPVSLKGYSITMSSKLSAGSHTFGLTNDGKQNHEFVLFRTDLPADSLPVDANGEVIEDSPELEVVADSGSDLKPGETRGVPAKLDPGHYAAVCNLPEHYRRGMYADVTVK